MRLNKSFIYLFFGFLPLSVNLILAPIFTSIFSQSDYGILGLAGVFQNIFTVLIGLGLQTAVSRYYFIYKKKRRLVDTLYSTVIISIVLVFVFFLLFLSFFGDAVSIFILSDTSFLFHQYGVWVYLNSLFLVLNIVFLSYYRNERRVWRYGTTALSFFVATVAGNLIGVLVFDAGVYGSIVGRSIGSMLATIPVSLIFLYQGKFVIRRRLVFKLLRFGLPLVPYGFLMMLYESIDKIIIERYFTNEELGIYTLTYQIVSIISVFIFSLYNVIQPTINDLLTTGGKTLESIRSYFDIFILVGLSVVSISYALVESLVLLIIDPKFHGVLDSIAILMVAFIARIYYLLYSITILFNHRTQLFNYMTALAIVGGVLIFHLFKGSLGIVSVYYCVAAIKFIQALSCYIYYRTSNFYHVAYNGAGWINITSCFLFIIGILMPFVDDLVPSGRLLLIGFLALSVLLNFKRVRALRMNLL